MRRAGSGGEEVGGRREQFRPIVADVADRGRRPPAGEPRRGQSNQSLTPLEDVMPEHDERKPSGSGIFALLAGIAFLVAFVASFMTKLTDLNPYYFLQGWLGFAMLILFAWGANRVIKSWRVKPFEVGQDTFNFVVAIVGATLALFALVK